VQGDHVNALIVDDERLARSELRRLLAAHPDVVIAGEAANIADAERWLRGGHVDVLLLDIQMPGGTGFDLLERLDAVPLVIFTTAYDEHAVRAFEVNAFDYLMKPIRADRLAAALAKVRMTRSAGRRPMPDRVFLRDGERCWIVAVADIVLFEAEGNYARACFGKERPLIRTSLQALESRVDPTLFFRASRRHLINLRHVEAVEGGVDESYTVRMRGGHSVAVSRRQSRKLRDTLSL
jgi:two-component system, LytTR family, response regulator